MAPVTGIFILAFACLPETETRNSPTKKGSAFSNRPLPKNFPVVAYNFKDDEFLVVSLLSDSLRGTRDVYGQFVKPDGSLRGGPFPICVHPADQSCPDVAYGTTTNTSSSGAIPGAEGDIYGARLDASGRKLKNANIVADTTFPICSQDSAQLNPRIAHNTVDNNYLGGLEGLPQLIRPQLQKPGSLPSSNLDLYGERLNPQGLPMTREIRPAPR